MADPVDEYHGVYRAVKVIEYPLPPSVKDDGFRELHEMANYVKEFRENLFNKAKMGNTFLCQTEYFHYQVEVPQKYIWENVPSSIRETILIGLFIHGRAAILQKELFRQYIEYIQGDHSKSRILNECNGQLEHAWDVLRAFSAFDERIENLCNQVNYSYMANPLLFDVEDTAGAA